MSKGKNAENKNVENRNVENKNVERSYMRIKKKNGMLYCYEHDSLFQY